MSVWLGSYVVESREKTLVYFEYLAKTVMGTFLFSKTESRMDDIYIAKFNHKSLKP